MNYLAHIVLSGENPHVRIGNFIGDAVKGHAYTSYPVDFQRGILLHRQIDAFSDMHPLVREAVKLGRPVLGRYAAVVTDIYFDHFLALYFRDYYPVSLRRMAWGFYRDLLWHYRYLPPRFQGFLWHFVLTDRLCRYVSRKGIRESLTIMSEYRGLKVEPSAAMDFLEEYERELLTLFRDFYPELQSMCQCELERLTSSMLNS